MLLKGGFFLIDFNSNIIELIQKLCKQEVRTSLFKMYLLCLAKKEDLNIEEDDLTFLMNIGIVTKYETSYSLTLTGERLIHDLLLIRNSRHLI